MEMVKPNSTIVHCPKCRGRKLIYVIAAPKSPGSLTCAKCLFEVSWKTDSEVIDAWESARFWQNMKDASEIIKTWPKWKQDIVLGRSSKDD